MNDLFEQMANISKAHGYDILSQQVKDLKMVIKELVVAVENKLPETEINHIINRAKILSL